MKAELVDVSETQKRLVVEIPSSVVDAEIERVTQAYGRSARIPGFRTGKIPPGLVRQRFRHQILHDVAHDLIPRAVDDALREHQVEPLDTPDVRDVTVEEGQPLRFTASFETVPPVDPGEYGTLGLRRPPAVLEADAVDKALARLRDRMARFEPVEGRGVEPRDTVTVDLERSVPGPPASGTGGGGPAGTERHEDVVLELGTEASPPGFDDELIGLGPGDRKTFTLRYPDDYAAPDLAGTAVTYSVTLKAIRRRVLPELDDELAKDLRADSLAALRERVREDLLREADRQADRQLRADLLRELAGRVGFEAPGTLVELEMTRRTEELARRLAEQHIDPAATNLDWRQIRESQRDAAQEAVKSSLVLDEVARRETLGVSEEDVDSEVARFAERVGRTPAAVRAGLEKEGGLERLRAGLRREKAIDFLLSRARIERG